MSQLKHLYDLFLSSKGVCIDTRKLKPGQLYIAIKGDNFDGNKFALDALQKGALACIVSDKSIVNEQCYVVEYTLETLQQLANHHRRQFDIPVIGITGSNGKTTTKELIYSVLSKEKIVNATVGNLNNHLGVPLTILSWSANTEIAIVEMGANHVGEIADLCKIAEPTLGLITNIGKAHLEGFGGLEGVKKGKSELFAWLAKSNGKVFYNIDDDLLSTTVSQFQLASIHSYGKSERANTQAEKLGQTFLELLYDKEVIKTQLVGDYNFYNAVAAMAIGEEFNISTPNIKNALENYNPTNNRSQVVEIGNNKFILDAYNANPTSMKMAIENLQNQEAENKALILGDMLELGDYSKKEHQAILDMLQVFNADNIVLVGPEFEQVKSNDFTFVKSNVEAKEWLTDKAFNNTTVLVKGSRGIALEKVLER